jgi:hypothetical protein
LHATPFVPSVDSKAMEKYPGRSGKLLDVESLPIGLSPTDELGAETVCMEHLELLLESPSTSLLLFNNRTSALSKSILKTIFTFYHSLQPVR